jgi:hypothetical protein
MNIKTVSWKNIYKIGKIFNIEEKYMEFFNEEEEIKNETGTLRTKNSIFLENYKPATIAEEETNQPVIDELLNEKDGKEKRSLSMLRNLKQRMSKFSFVSYLLYAIESMKYNLQITKLG